jgi:hypothetical protein
MNRTMKLTARIAGAMAFAAIFGTSAFGESRHLGTTEQDGGRTERTYKQRSDGQREQRNDRRDTAQLQPSYGRRADSQQNQGRGRAESQPYQQRDYGRSQSYDRRAESRGVPSYGTRDNRRSISAEGRVRSISREGNGYRVRLDRGGYSFFVPEARFRMWPLRAGLSIRIGGYLNPLGYVDAYDLGPLGGPVYTSGDLRGIVESVDYRRGTLAVRDDISGSFVTVILRRNDSRMDHLRSGDFVDFSGAWDRGGVFEAYLLEDFRPGRY